MELTARWVFLPVILFFVGSIGRPDLLEEAAGMAGTAEPGARDLYQSTLKFKQLPDHLQIWPAHGAGSACGKGLGAIPTSTVGYEKLFNPALQYEDEQAFVDYILSEQPEAPKYFAIMKRVNKEGPAILGENQMPQQLPLAQLSETVQKEMVVDTSAAKKFLAGHVPGTLSLPPKYVAMWGGSLLGLRSIRVPDFLDSMKSAKWFGFCTKLAWTRSADIFRPRKFPKPA